MLKLVKKRHRYKIILILASHLKVRNLIHVLKSKKVNFEHKHDLSYHGKCTANNCNNDYVGETVRRISERITDQNGRDVNCSLLKYHMVKEHPCLQNKDFVILYTLVILL